MKLRKLEEKEQQKCWILIVAEDVSDFQKSWNLVKCFDRTFKMLSKVISDPKYLQV